MKHVVNIAEGRNPDMDSRSLRARVLNRESPVLRDTYYLIDRLQGPSQRMTCGHTTIYPTGTTTGHSHDDLDDL